MKRIYALLTSAVMLFSFGGLKSEENTFQASAQLISEAGSECVSFDAETATLTLSENVDADAVKEYAMNDAVIKVVCAADTVLPEDCYQLFK